MKILVVEDEIATRMYLASALRSMGHEVVEAENGADGLKLFKAEKPDFVLSDIMMPIMTGLQMLEKIRNINYDAIFVIQSSMDSPEYTLEALRLRANDYLIKPVEEKQLAAIIDKYSQVLATRTREREILGMISQKNLVMKLKNDLSLVAKITDRLMQETESGIPADQKLGIHLGLVEIITNAMEHGNLEITYDEKTEALENLSEGWLELIKSRSEKFSERIVTVEFNMGEELCEWIISDDGPGFDWNNLPDPTDPENLLAPHGRGIMLTSMQFDKLEFLERGNKVRLVKKRQAIT